MAVDQFGNPLTEEELYRLMMEQQQMGLLPGLLGGPAVDTFSGIPSSLPAYGPAAGLGPSSYMGAPQGMPTYNQSPTLAAPSILVDTQAGMGTVPELAFGAYGAGSGVPGTVPIGSDYTPQELSTPIQDLLQQDIPSNVVPLDPTGGLSATDPNLQGVTPTSMAMVGTNAFGIPDRTYGPTTETVPVADPNSYPNMAAAYPVTDPVSVMETAQMLGSDPALQAGDDFFGDGDVSGDYSQVLADAGMGTVPTVEKSFSLSDYLPDFSTLDKIGIDPILGLLDLESGSETREKQKTIEDLADAGLITGEESDQYKTDTWMNDLSYSTPKSLAAAAGLALGAIPLQMLDELSLSKGYKSGMANIRGLTETPNTQLDAVIDLVNLGVLSRKDVKDSIPEMKSQVDTFKDIPDVTAPAGPTPAEIAAANAAANALAAANARAKTAAANRAKLASQKAAAKAKRDEDKRVAALIAKASKNAAKREAAERKSLEDRVRRDMNAARDKGSVSNRDVQAAIAAMQGNEFGGTRGFEPGMDITGFTDVHGFGVG